MNAGIRFAMDHDRRSLIAQYFDERANRIALPLGERVNQLAPGISPPSVTTPSHRPSTAKMSETATSLPLACGNNHRAISMSLNRMRISGKLNARFGEVEQARREVLRSA